MRCQWIVLLFLYLEIKCQQQLTMVSKTHSAPLEKYSGYIDTVILHFKVPEDTNFVSFKFRAEETALSLFDCEPKDVTLYLKRGAPPVINPDGSKFPDGFLNSGRPEMHLINFTSNEVDTYINISAPYSGSYFAAAFKSYTNPKDDRITQQGLTPNCLTFLNAAMYISHKPSANVIVADKDLHVLLDQHDTRLYKFYIPDIADSAFLSIKNIYFCENCTDLHVRIQPNTIPKENETLHSIQLKKEDYYGKSFSFRFPVLESCWYYVDFKFDEKYESVANHTSEFIFKIKYFSSFINRTYDNDTQESMTELKSEALTSNGLAQLKPRVNNSVTFKHAVMRNYGNDYLDYNIHYKQYNLVRDGHTESFMYSFDLRPTPDGHVPLAVNITNEDVFILKFQLNQGLDIGGTLQFGLAFKPRIKTVGRMRIFEEEPENHTLIACIKNNGKAIPIWPDRCVYHNEPSKAPIILNRSVDNNTVYIPYPEPGNWYTSFKLFCGPCNKCNCSQKCKDEYKNCTTYCEMHCGNSTSCDSCIENCERTIISEPECANCDCEGPCQRNNVSCSSSVIFAVASYPCVSGKCGKNGKCMYMVSEGLAYSICVCSNNYKGWDCSDDSQASSFAMIILELLLLVLSNLTFLPAVYVAYRREYFVEAIVYFSTCFFSTFYHSCDAGENIISFCLVRLNVLQFSDFFSGLLSIWVTIIAMAYLSAPWPSICHITGAILLAFGTTINKTSLWVFGLPFLTGIVILVISWYMHYRKTRVRFPSKRYMFIIFPTGIIIVGVGLLMYALLQTQSNYKYLHSMWHVLMAVAIIILLPNKQTFLPPAINAID